MSVARSLWFTVALSTGCDRVFGLELREADAALPIDASFDASLALCPPAYTPVTGAETRYRFVAEYITWEVAQEECARDTSPSITHLVELGSVEELVALQVAFPAQPAWRAWTGYARNTGSKPFEFFATTGPMLSLGDPVWATGEPNNSPMHGEETVTFIFHDTRIVDGPPTFQMFAICECDGRPVTRTFAVLP